MKIKIKKSILKEAIENHIAYILENKSTPLMKATFKLLEMFENCNESQRKNLNEVFSLLEQELYLSEGELTSLVLEMQKDPEDVKNSKEDKDKTCSKCQKLIIDCHCY